MPRHKNKLFLLLFSLFLIGTLSAYGYEDISIATIANGECINITQTSENATFINITSIISPDSEIKVSNVAMENDSTEFHYNFCSTAKNGQYFINYKGDEGGNISLAKNWFFVTSNGREEASGAVIVFFVLAFFIITGSLFFFMAHTIFFFFEFKFADRGAKPVFGFRELIMNLSAYMLLWVYWGLSITYLGNNLINSITGIAIFITTWTNFILSIVAIIVCYIAVGFKGILEAGIKE